MALVETANSFSKLVEVADGFTELERSGVEDGTSGYHKVVSLIHHLCLSIELAEKAGFSRADIEGVLEPVWKVHSKSPLFRGM